MDRSEFKEILVSFFPSFEGYWDKEDINREEDGSFTAHGLLSAFFFFYKENYTGFQESTLRIFASKLEDIVAADPNNESDVANAICTSFLELLDQRQEGKILEKYLGSECASYLRTMRGEHGS